MAYTPVKLLPQTLRMNKKNKPTQLQISPWHIEQAIRKAPKAASDRHGGNASAAIRFIIENYNEPCPTPPHKK